MQQQAVLSGQKEKKDNQMPLFRWQNKKNITQFIYYSNQQLLNWVFFLFLFDFLAFGTKHRSRGDDTLFLASGFLLFVLKLMNISKKCDKEFFFIPFI